MGKRCSKVVITDVVLSERQRAVSDRYGEDSEGRQYGGWYWRGAEAGGQIVEGSE